MGVVEVEFSCRREGGNAHKRRLMLSGFFVPVFEGVTYAQAMKVFERFVVDSVAVPTVAHELDIPYETVCAVLDGELFPGARFYWLNRLF